MCESEVSTKDDQEQPQILRLRLAQKTSQTSLRMTALLREELLAQLYLAQLNPYSLLPGSALLDGDVGVHVDDEVVSLRFGRSGS